MDQSFKFIEDDKVIAEFTNFQSAVEFILKRHYHRWEGQQILKQKDFEKGVRTKWVFIGVFIGEGIILAITIISKLFF